MADTFVITYGKMRGRAEIISITNFEEWPEIKKKLVGEGKLAYGQIPLLEHNGKPLVQSNAIVRHIGRLFKLYGNNNDEQFKIDMIMDGVSDVREVCVQMVIHSKDPALKEKFIAENIPPFLENIEKIKHTNPHDFFVGNTPTIADISVYDMLDSLLAVAPDCLSSHPILLQFRTKFESIPKIKEYLNSDRRAKE